MLQELRGSWEWMFRRIEATGTRVSIEEVVKIVGIVTPRHLPGDHCSWGCEPFLGLFELRDGRVLGVKATCHGSPLLDSGETARITAPELLRREFFNSFDCACMGIASSTDQEIVDHDASDPPEDEWLQ